MSASVTHMRRTRIVTLIETVVCEGKGTGEDPVRLVTYYTTPEGGPVAVSDRYGIREPDGIDTDGLFPHERGADAKTIGHSCVNTLPIGDEAERAWQRRIAP